MESIRVENLSKRFEIGEIHHNSLRDTIMSFVRKPLQSDETRQIWALKDISFSVNDGETIGIIGNNGAGKSTLLKILSRITKPTRGTAELHGRVGSLLEVGTGFHNELTGRENIYLNGAILGMKRAEIDKHFDEIIAFAEIEKFLDTPAKHYSTGMFMRLAFAVAAHLEPEILIVDEVLAVGDVNFQRKCLNKMKDVSKSGRTVLFVSHDMSAITRICSRAIALSKGEIVSEGTASEVVRDYLNSSWGVTSEKDFTQNLEEAPASDAVRLKRIRVVDENGKTNSSFDIRRKIGIETTYDVLKEGFILLPGFEIFNEERIQLFTVHDVSKEWQRQQKEKGEYVSTVWIPANFMAEGAFFVNFEISNYVPILKRHFQLIDAVSFDVVDSLEGNTARGDYGGKMEGLIRPILDVETHKIG